MILGGRDQYLLERYFSEGREERSNLGGILDHIERYSFREPRQLDPEDFAATRDHPDSCACPLCLHDVSARPTAEVRMHAKDGPDDGLLALLGGVSRRLSVVRRTDPTSYLVLEAWFGDQGARYTPEARLTVLLPHTPTGRELVRARAAKERGPLTKQVHPLRKSADELRMEAVLALAVANDGLKQLVARARVEAMALLERASQAWLSTAQAKPVPHRAQG